MTELAALRQFFAAEIAAVADITTAGLVDALATVPREQFLGPGPWLVRGEGDLTGSVRRTPDADPRRVYHNYSIALDPERQLFNGAPSLLAGSIDKLGLAGGARVLHIGTGSGYYTAVIAHVVGPSGAVVAVEVDPVLAAEARRNLSPMPWVDLRTGDGTAIGGETFDAILVNVGVTHPQETWLDALVPGGRLILPLTVVFGPTGSTIGKGIQVLLTKQSDAEFAARVITFVAIYSGVNLRDETIGAELGRALTRTPFPRLRRLRRDAHEASPGCWLHTPRFCFTL